MEFGASPDRVAILRALALGDLLCAVPTLRALRHAWPKAEMVLIGLPWARQFVRRFARYLDGFREFPGYPGLPEREPDVAQIPAFLTHMQREHFDLAIQLHGSGSFVNSLTVLLGAPRCAGFFVQGEYCPDSKMFAPWPQTGLEIHRLQSLAAHLGIPSRGDELEFPLSGDDFRELAQLPHASDLVPGRYVCVHPGASAADRRWPVENFAAVADALAAGGRQIVLTGVESERALTAAVRRAMRRPAIDLAGETTLGSLGALVSRAALLVGNDTGVSHVAAALRTPSVVISTGDNPARWAPINQALHRVLCRPEGVSIEEVRLTAGDQLRRFSRRAFARLPHQPAALCMS